MRVAKGTQLQLYQASLTPWLPERERARERARARAREREREVTDGFRQTCHGAAVICHTAVRAWLSFVTNTPFGRRCC